MCPPGHRGPTTAGGQGGPRIGSGARPHGRASREERGSTARDDHGEHESSTVAGSPATRTAGSRRGLLGAAAGGFALAAGGLVVPAWLEEAAAGEKPVRRVQDRTGQRNRKQRNHKQSSDKNDKNKEKNDRDGQGLLRNFALTVVKNNSARDWWFGVGSQGFFTADIEQRTVLHKSTRRLLRSRMMRPISLFLMEPLMNSGIRWAVCCTSVIPALALSRRRPIARSTTSSKASRCTQTSPIPRATSSGVRVNSRTINFEFVAFLVTRTPDSQRYKEFTLTFT